MNSVLGITVQILLLCGSNVVFSTIILDPENLNANQIITSSKVNTEVHKLNTLDLLLDIFRINGDLSLTKTKPTTFLQSTSGYNLFSCIFNIVTFIPRTILKLAFLIPRIVVYTILMMSGIIGTIFQAGFAIARSLLGYPKTIFGMIWGVIF